MDYPGLLENLESLECLEYLESLEYLECLESLEYIECIESLEYLEFLDSPALPPKKHQPHSSPSLFFSSSISLFCELYALRALSLRSS